MNTYTSIKVAGKNFKKSFVLDTGYLEEGGCDHGILQLTDIHRSRITNTSYTNSSMNKAVMGWVYKV